MGWGGSIQLDALESAPIDVDALTTPVDGRSRWAEVRRCHELAAGCRCAHCSRVFCFAATRVERTRLPGHALLTTAAASRRAYATYIIITRRIPLMFVSRARDGTVMPAVRLSTQGSASPWIQRADRFRRGQSGWWALSTTKPSERGPGYRRVHRRDGVATGAETCQGLRSGHRCTPAGGVHSNGYARGRGAFRPTSTRHVQTPATSGIVPFCAATRSKSVLLTA